MNAATHTTASALLDRPAAEVADVLGQPMHVGALNPAWQFLIALERVSWAGRTTAAARLRDSVGTVRAALTGDGSFLDVEDIDGLVVEACRFAEKQLAEVVSLRERDLEHARNDLEQFQRFLGDGDE